MPSSTSEQLGANLDAALSWLGSYFVNESPLHKAAEELARRLDELGIDYAIAGALSLAAHGLVRATEDVDVLLDRVGLERFKETWVGRGYIDLRPGGKAVRDTQYGVKIDFLIQGDFPGDGKPKPVSFPDPREAGMSAGRFRVLSLPRLVELKLASGMTAPHRLQDLADVQRLIGVRKLPREFVENLDPYVRVQVRRALANRATRTRRLLASAGSVAEREHALDRDARAFAQLFGHLDARREIAQREVDLLERVLLHVRALVARAVRLGRRRDELLVRRGLLHLVEDAGSRSRR